MSTFKGVVCTSISKDVKEGIESLKVADVPRQPLGTIVFPTKYLRIALGERDVRIRVHATSLNFFDLLILVGKYQHKPKLPFVVVRSPPNF
jgi:NADPH:quinone reductase-like Zn-dependent oxidoreductase